MQPFHVKHPAASGRSRKEARAEKIVVNPNWIQISVFFQ
jgi:hypothetical protein